MSQHNYSTVAPRKLAEIHQWSVDNPALSYAGTYAAASFAWYALPDVCKVRPLRIVAKSSLIAAMAAYETHLGTSSPFARTYGDSATPNETYEELNLNLSERQKVAVAGAVLATGIAVTVLGEKLVFKLGERRAKAGKKLAHTLPALFIAGIAAAACHQFYEDSAEQLS